MYTCKNYNIVMEYLYSVFLWWKIEKNSLIEDHKLVFVVAKNEKEARKVAKNKWDVIDVHVDWTQRLDMVDWFKINLEKSGLSEDNFIINPKYSK